MRVPEPGQRDKKTMTAQVRLGRASPLRSGGGFPCEQQQEKEKHPRATTQARSGAATRAAKQPSGTLTALTCLASQDPRFLTPGIFSTLALQTITESAGRPFSPALAHWHAATAGRRARISYLDVSD